MSSKKRIDVIGAGGVGSWLIPVLAKKYDVRVIDGDDFEPNNRERQNFPNSKLYENKAKAMGQRFEPVFLTDKDQLDADLVVCCTDTAESKQICLSAGMPVVIAGNETYSSEAYLYVPGKTDNPAEYYTEDGETGHDCRRDPQTVEANFMAAAMALKLVQMFFDPEWNGVHHMRGSRFAIGVEA